MQSELFSVRRASKEFFHDGISEWTLRSWLRTGRLPACKAGARVFIRREDLEAFLRPRPVCSAEARANQSTVGEAAAGPTQPEAQ